MYDLLLFGTNAQFFHLQEVGNGGAIFFFGAGSASIEGSSFIQNFVGGPNGMGGCFGMKDGGSLYVRDTLVNRLDRFCV